MLRPILAAARWPDLATAALRPDEAGAAVARSGRVRHALRPVFATAAPALSGRSAAVARTGRSAGPETVTAASESGTAAAEWIRWTAAAKVVDPVVDGV